MGCRIQAVLTRGEHSMRKRVTERGGEQAERKPKYVYAHWIELHVAGGGGGGNACGGAGDGDGRQPWVVGENWREPGLDFRER